MTTPRRQKQWNFTDPESPIMVTKTQGGLQAYNGQSIVEANEGVLVVADHPVSPPNDRQDLMPTVDAVAATTDRQLGHLTAGAETYRCPADQA